MYDETKRIPGGSCYGDAVFRINASPEDYAKRMAQRVIEKEWGEESPFRFFSSEGFFIIAKDENPVIIKDYEFVERMRCEDIHGYEKWVHSIIRKG